MNASADRLAIMDLAARYMRVLDRKRENTPTFSPALTRL